MTSEFNTHYNVEVNAQFRGTGREKMVLSARVESETEALILQKALKDFYKGFSVNTISGDGVPVDYRVYAVALVVKEATK